MQLQSIELNDLSNLSVRVRDFSEDIESLKNLFNELSSDYCDDTIKFNNCLDEFNGKISLIENNLSTLNTWSKDLEFRYKNDLYNIFNFLQCTNYAVEMYFVESEKKHRYDVFISYYLCADSFVKHSVKVYNSVRFKKRCKILSHQQNTNESMTITFKIGFQKFAVDCYCDKTTIYRI